MSPSKNPLPVSKTLSDYAAGAMQKGTRRVGSFLAPTVLVPLQNGEYKKWSEKSRFYVPQTLRALSGRATEVVSDAENQNYNCQPNGLDYIVDRALGDDVDQLVKDGADFLGDIFGLVHLFEAVVGAKEAAGAGENAAYDIDQDPVELIDAKIEAVQLAGKCEQAGVLFGAHAWKRFKNHPTVRERGLPLKWESNPTLFTADAEYMGCFAIIDTAPEGIDPVMDFLLKDEILVFGRHPVPHRRDPSFMKTLRHEGTVENLRILPTNDDRKVQVMLDWSSEIKITNASAIRRINYQAGA
jgi:hypothetical protein